MEGDALEVRDDKEARDLLFPPGVHQPPDVVHVLPVGFFAVLPGGFVLDEDAGRPE